MINSSLGKDTNGTMANLTDDDFMRFELARDLANAVIAVYSSRINLANTSEEVNMLLGEQSSYIAFLHRLDVSDKQDVARVLDKYPRLLDKLRGSTVGN